MPTFPDDVVHVDSDFPTKNCDSFETKESRSRLSSMKTYVITLTYGSMPNYWVTVRVITTNDIEAVKQQIEANKIPNQYGPKGESPEYIFGKDVWSNDGDGGFVDYRIESLAEWLSGNQFKFQPLT